jgi:hypothetical protein
MQEALTAKGPDRSKVPGPIPSPLAGSNPALRRGWRGLSRKMVQLAQDTRPPRRRHSIYKGNVRGGAGDEISRIGGRLGRTVAQRLGWMRTSGGVIWSEPTAWAMSLPNEAYANSFVVVCLVPWRSMPGPERSEASR